jgi:molybdopterin converting factor small subunit
MKRTMAVNIKLNLPLQRLANNREKIEATGFTVKECLDDLIRQIPGSKSELFDPEGLFSLLILLNNEPLPDQNLNYSLKDGDELWLLSIVSGGSSLNINQE